MSADRLSSIWAQPDKKPVFTLLDWEVVLGQAMQARLNARLARHMAEHGWLSETPLEVRQYLEGGLRLSDRQQHEVQWEVDCIWRALRELGGPIVLLKGAAYLIAGLPSGRGRLFSDIDIMVHHEQLSDVEGALFRHGWIGEERDPYNDRYYREWMHEIPPMKHVRRNTVIDVHHTITPPTSRFKVDASKLFEQLILIDESRQLYVLAPCDMVLHSAVHLFQEGEFNHGLRDLLDLSDLLRHFGSDPDFWPRLFGRARELGLGEPLFHALTHIARLFGLPPIPDLKAQLQQIEPNVLSRSLMSLLLSRGLLPDHPSCRSLASDFSRWLLYVRAHYLRMPWYLVVPHLIRKAVMRLSPKNES